MPRRHSLDDSLDAASTVASTQPRRLDARAQPFTCSVAGRPTTTLPRRARAATLELATAKPPSARSPPRASAASALASALSTLHCGGRLGLRPLVCSVASSSGAQGSAATTSCSAGASSACPTTRAASPGASCVGATSPGVTGNRASKRRLVAPRLGHPHQGPGGKPQGVPHSCGAQARRPPRRRPPLRLRRFRPRLVEDGGHGRTIPCGRGRRPRGWLVAPHEGRPLPRAAHLHWPVGRCVDDGGLSQAVQACV